ncbi:L-threonylcarbamoyladenylate synthase [soil metagenome]
MSDRKPKLLNGSHPADIAEAAALLAAGRLVALPTETVYGLGADATNEAAVRAIFEAKGRPSNNPIIVHVADAVAARELTTGWNARAEALAAEFWPGPLTLVLPAGQGIAASVLAGGRTVGVRVPDHPVALALLRAVGKPIAAPSANRSNRLSPTTAAAVLDTLDGLIDAVLDGGACAVGIESTVVDVSGDEVVVLRPGMISEAMIEAALLKAGVGGRSGFGRDDQATDTLTAAEVFRSPGMFPRHYAPGIPLVVVDEVGDVTVDDFVIGVGGQSRARRILLPEDPAGYATGLYAALRTAELSGASRIVLERPPSTPEWAAIHDRLGRAAAK